MNAKRQISVIFVLTMSLLISGCGPGQLFGPAITPTSTKTLMPTATLTPTVTSTPTITPTMTKKPTSTPTPTPTLPIDVPMPMEGKGIVVGQVLKGGMPAPKMRVQLCDIYLKTIYGVCGSGVKYEGVTDDNGFFIFSKVEPETYEVFVVLLPGMRITYWTTNINIKAGEIKNIGAFNLP